MIRNIRLNGRPHKIIHKKTTETSEGNSNDSHDVKEPEKTDKESGLSAPSSSLESLSLSLEMDTDGSQSL